MEKDKQKRSVLSVVKDTEDIVRERGTRVGSEIGDVGLFEELDWEEHPSGYGVWARLMQRYLSEWGEKVRHQYLDVAMWRWKKIYRRHTARFLEMRAAREWEAGRRELAQYLLFYAQAIAQGRDLNSRGEFLDQKGYIMGECRECGGTVKRTDFSGLMEKVEAGDRYKHGNAIFKCPTCGTDSVARRLLAPNRDFPDKHA